MEEEIRAVVLGWQKSDKASVINGILGESVESDKYFVRSVKRDGEVNGRKITLINTLCWWENCCLQDSPEIVKQELVCSVFLCPPGPHVFLLVINLSVTFTEENRVTLEEHLSVFGERIWRHTIVIFTRVDSLKDKPIEEGIQNQGDLQKIIQRCGGRFHVFEEENKSVQELIVKIDDGVTANNGHFDTHDEELLEMKRKRQENEERAGARQKMVQDNRERLKETTYVRRLEEVSVVLLGWVFSGKSLAGNIILNKDEFVTGGRTGKCSRGSGDVDGRKITVMDTPSWWKYFSSKLNPDCIRSAIMKSILKGEKFPHAILLVIPGDESYQEEQLRITVENMSILGEDVWRHTIVLFTWADKFPDVSIEEHIESEGAALQWLVEKCRNRYHVFDNMNTNNRDQVSELLQKIDEMAAENTLFHLRGAEEVNVSVSDTQQDQQDEEMSLNADQLLQYIHQELKNRHQEIKYKLEELGMDLPGCAENKSAESMDEPIYVSADHKLKEKIRREGSRWEAILREEVRNVQNPEGSHEKVLWWIQRNEGYSSTSGYDSMSECTDAEEDPQNPETSENTSKLNIDKEYKLHREEDVCLSVKRSLKRKRHSD